MVAKGDTLHIEAMNAMRKQHMTMTPDDMKLWMEKFHKEFAAILDD